MGTARRHQDVCSTCSGPSQIAVSGNACVAACCNTLSLSKQIAFRVPEASERKAAIGCLRGLPYTLTRCLDLSEAWFEPIAVPGISDWLSEHPETMQTFDTFKAAHELHRDAIGPNEERKCVHILPLGPLDSDLLQKAVQVCAAFFWPLRVALLRPREVPKAADCQGVLKSEAILQWMAQSLRRDSVCTIALTSASLTISATQTFGASDWSMRVGVFTLAPYVHPEDVAVGSRLPIERTVKLLTHEVLHTFGILHCCYFQCLMNGSNNLEEMDNKPPFLCAMCLRKLYLCTGLEPLQRYSRLAHAWHLVGFEDIARWYHLRVQLVHAAFPAQSTQHVPRLSNGSARPGSAPPGGRSRKGQVDVSKFASNASDKDKVQRPGSAVVKASPKAGSEAKSRSRPSSARTGGPSLGSRPSSAGKPSSSSGPETAINAGSSLSGISMENLPPRYHNVLLSSPLKQRLAMYAQRGPGCSGRVGPPGSPFDITSDRHLQNLRKWRKIAGQLARTLEANYTNPFISQTCQRMRIRYAHMIQSSASTNTAFDASEFEREWKAEIQEEEKKKGKSRASFQKARNTLQKIGKFSVEWNEQDPKEEPSSRQSMIKARLTPRASMPTWISTSLPSTHRASEIQSPVSPRSTVSSPKAPAAPSSPKGSRKFFGRSHTTHFHAKSLYAPAETGEEQVSDDGLQLESKDILSRTL
eukprot:gnl/MRDRNA2_/MRDRNA2_80322_c0_seq1.p1 gnl/MRDRNA2_/MRDRNA2_80322_c0~~gnl/MRDRNA2_/MRDRNA2_80322_c0_seq1.p1  ORF type:complete len:698 (-),score=69.35 gnl/MRDRNA2_/MRDRNA2_80322_c0_seq1:1-2094(-)